MESKAVNAVFSADLAVSSSKGMTGHTLGAAAALELAFCWLPLNRDDEQGALIPNVNEDEQDSELAPLNLVKKGMVLGRKINTCQAGILQFDIADRAQCTAQINNDIENRGAYYGVVCNAGVTADSAFPSLTGDEWDRVVHTNLDGFYNILQPVVMPMIRRRKPGRDETGCY